MNKNIFGERLAVLLKENNLTQREAGRLIGVSDVCISRYIKGYRVPKITNVIALSKALGVTVDYILGFSDSKTYGPKASWTEAKSECRRERITKVYVIEQGEYSDRHVVGVTETEEEAKTICNAIDGDSCRNSGTSYTEYDTKRFSTKKIKYGVDFDEAFEWSAECIEGDSFYDEYTENCHDGAWYDYIIFANSKEQAIKIAQDMAAEEKAREAGLT